MVGELSSLPWTRQEYGGWLAAFGSAAQLFLGASRPTSPVAGVTATASVLRMLLEARVSIPLTTLSDSQNALGVVMGDDFALSEIRLVQLARSEARCYRQCAGIEGRYVAAHRELAVNEAADRLPDAGRRRWVVPDRAAALISCTPSFPPESEVTFLTLVDRNQGRGRSVKAFST